MAITRLFDIFKLMCLHFLLAMMAYSQPLSTAGSNQNSAVWLKTTSGCNFQSFDWRPDITATWSGQCLKGRLSGAGNLTVTSAGQTEIYYGQMADGQPEGHGVLKTADGNTISGLFHNGVISGSVDFTGAGGFRYSGGWLKGSEEGRGSGIWPDNTSYEGDWHLGQRSGHGRLRFPNGDTYDGDFAQNKKNGYGVLWRADGSQIEGNWSDDQPDGKVTTIDAAGNRYQGTFRDGKRNGQGFYANRNGDSYEGNWVNNFPEGHGRYRWSNGDLYDGNWGSHLPNGQGTFVRGNVTYSGSWLSGCLRVSGQTIALFVDQKRCENKQN